MDDDTKHLVSEDALTTAEQLSWARLEHLNHLLQTVREAGRTLSQARDPIGLCAGVCRSLVQTRGYVVVWIGRLDWAAGVVLPVAVAGAEAEAFPRARITWDDPP